MNILRVFDRYTDSALNYFLMERITQLNSEQFRMRIVYLDKDSGNVPDEHGGVPMHLLSQTRIPAFSVSTVVKLVRLVKDKQIDIIHCDNYKGVFYGVMASLFCKNVKVMCLMHGLNRCRNWRRKLFFSLFGKRVDRFIGCSSRVAEDIKKYPGVREDQVVSIANSTDYEKHAGVEFDPKARSEFGFYDDDFVFINVGRLVETKGLEYLLEAFEMVAKERPQARLLIVGSGRLREHLEQSAPDGVVFAGFRRDVTRLMKAGDCFVLSSIREGMPLVIFEAMSAGIPVVTTNTGAAEQVEGPDGEKYGFLCPIADSRSLAAAMKEAMDMTPVRRDDLVRKAARRVEKEYSHAAAVENLKNLYQKVYEENR